MLYSLTANPSEENAVSEDVNLAPSISNSPSSSAHVGIQNTYRYPALLANGKEGNVYLVRCNETKTCYALKIAASPATSHNVKKEIRILSTLHHPSIMPHIDNDALSTFLITPYYPFLTLRHQQTLASLFPLETITLLHALLSTCAYLSAQQLIHRDIKPENILIASRTPVLTIRLTDFGRCISSPSTNEEDERAGTVIYAAPEAFGTEGLWTCKSDVWSAGLVVLECAAWPLAEERRPGREMIGEEPFGKESVFAGGWRGVVRGVLEKGRSGEGEKGGFGMRGVLDLMLREDVGERVGPEEALGGMGEGFVGGK